MPPTVVRSSVVIGWILSQLACSFVEQIPLLAILRMWLALGQGGSTRTRAKMPYSTSHNQISSIASRYSRQGILGSRMMRDAVPLYVVYIRGSCIIEIAFAVTSVKDFVSQKDKMFVYPRRLLILWLVTRTVCGAVHVELNDGQILAVDDEQNVTPTVDSEPGDPIFGGLTLRDLFRRQYCSAPGQNVICGNGCCPNNNYCCDGISCIDTTSRLCCRNGRQCYKGGDCCTDGNCVSNLRCSLRMLISS